MKKPVRAAALALAGAVTATLLVAGPSVADSRTTGGLEACPEGWKKVLGDAETLGSILQFCRKEMQLPDGHVREIYMAKMRADHVTQGFEYALTGEQEANPLLVADDVIHWLEVGKERDPSTVLAVNGTFFHNSGGYTGYFDQTAVSSFPFYTREPGETWGHLIATGRHPSTEGDAAPRRQCMSWRSDREARVQSAPWTLGTDDYWDVVDEIDALGGCTRGDGWHPYDDAEFLVGYDPWFDFEDEGEYNPATIVGVTSTGMRMIPDNTMCIMVGGWFEGVSVASAMLRDEFGCRPIMQLDGGHSSQLSYYGQDGYIRSPITGFGPAILHNRNVTHSLLIQ